MNCVIVGQGGHSKVIYDILLLHESNKIVAYLDDKFKEVSCLNGIYYGPLSHAKWLINEFEEIKFFIAIGNNLLRKKIVEELNLPEEFYITLIHKTAIISPSAKIGNGTVIMPKVVINADAKIGIHSIINTSSVIEHDSRIGNFVHVSPAATITGSVFIEEGVHVGAGTTIIPNIHIGSWSIIGAGATVISNLPSNCTAVGTPTKVIKNEGLRCI